MINLNIIFLVQQIIIRLLPNYFLFSSDVNGGKDGNPFAMLIDSKMWPSKAGKGGQDLESTHAK